MAEEKKNQNEIKLFENQSVRSVWDEENEKWWFSVVDVVAVLTGSENPRRYWSDLKKKLKVEGSEVYEKIVQLKMEAPDGKMRLTDVADTKQLLRLIQSVPSPKAEPFKLWLAQVGEERLNEVQDPELTIERAMYEYRQLGYSEEWIGARLQSIQFRKDLTDEWKRSGVNEGLDFAILTNIISQGWSGMTVSEYKKFKGLKKESLRDNMSSVELALNILAEATTTEISKSINPKGLDESKSAAREGGAVAHHARQDIEKRTGKSALTTQNAKDLKRLE